MSKKLIDKYAQLIVEMGVNVQKDQMVILNIESDQMELAQSICRHAYARGAKEVRVEIKNQEISKIHLQEQSVENYSDLSDWKLAKLQEAVDRLPAVIHVTSTDPMGMQGLDPQKMQEIQQRTYPQIKKYQEAMENKYPWTIVGAASKAWAKRVFPELKAKAAQKKLWQEIFKTVRVSKDKDPVQAWQDHNDKLAQKSKWLNEQKFDYLHYQAKNGTDLKVWLSDQIKWDGGSEKLGTGQVFNPNMPTEEIFTTPIAGKAEGRLYSSKALSYQGQLIDEFWLEFTAGKVSDFDAKIGKEVLTQLLGLDAGASMLGEVALVPHDSPISNSKILFYNTLFDENASCHFALGRGFSNLVYDYENYSKEEMTKMGVNDSMTHVDFMIGTADLSIDGYTRDGKLVPVFRNGNWAEV